MAVETSSATGEQQVTVDDTPSEQGEVSQERRIRLTLHLPYRARGEINAFRQILKELDRMKGSREEVRLTGYTFSDPVFNGFWRNKGTICEDKISILFSDLLTTKYKDLEKIENFVYRLHELVVEKYNANGRPQKEFWIVAQPITRYIK